MESALDELLDAQRAADDSDDDDISGEEEGSDDDSNYGSDDDSSTTPLCDDSEDYFVDLEDDGGELSSTQNKKRKSNQIDSIDDSGKRYAKRRIAEDSILSNHELEADEIKATETGPPLNFSSVNCKLPIDRLKVEYPLYVDALQHELLVEINEGEMLYLPCGWFHEVTSRSKPSSSDGFSMSPHHQAINYWFHPPDGLTYESPYSDNFWRKNWEARNFSDDR
jgi:hypothetical protein